MARFLVTYITVRPHGPYHCCPHLVRFAKIHRTKEQQGPSEVILAKLHKQYACIVRIINVKV